MAEILIASMPPIGHVCPLLTVAQGLVDRGDRVTFFTSARHQASIRAVGAQPHPLPRGADFDETRLNADLPGRAATSGIRRVNFDVIGIFVEGMQAQARELSKLLASRRFDAVIVDAAFFGILPLLLGDRGARPPVLAYTTTPLLVSSRDTAPGGMGLSPSATRLGRLRNRALNVLSRQVLVRRSQQAADRQLHFLNSRRLPVFILDSPLLADRFIVPTVPEFDYPRSDLPASVRYVGAVHPAPALDFTAPPWWGELDGDRPVVHVTQGTVDNTDLRRLVIPTIEALRDEDVIVVATTGGRAASALGAGLPANTYVADYIPHDVLLSRIDVMVTSGGYGTVQRALSSGVPLVVAGNTEDKPEVAARVSWAGAGVNLRTGTPTPGAVRTAVRTVLGDRGYLQRARELEVAFARRDGVAEIAALVDEVLAEWDTAVRR
jgi:MGT family glycosyltransferase